MPTQKQLQEQGLALSEKQKALALDDSRPWAERREEFENLEADIKETFAQYNAMKSVDDSPFAKMQDGTPTGTNTGGQVQARVKSPGEVLVESLTNQAPNRGPGIRLNASGVTSFQNAIITEAGGGVGGVFPQYVPGVTVPTLFKRLTVADLIPQGSTTSQSIIYVQETAVTNAAATVTEGAAKPQSDLTLAQVTEVVRKIATTAKISDEMINDVEYIQSYVNGRLVLFVKLAEEDQLLNGNGTPPNLTGILNRSGKQTAQALGADTRPDAIFKQITNIRKNAFLEPDGIVLHPTDWQSIRLLKDANGQYYGGGPFGFASYGNAGQAGITSPTTAGSDTLWGIPVVVTPSIAAGTGLVGAFGLSSQIYRREGIRVEATNSNEDDFLKNLIAVRVEERLALAVYRPAGFGTVTGL
jgi:HK97 family phage major capsid protein